MPGGSEEASEVTPFQWTVFGLAVYVSVRGYPPSRLVVHGGPVTQAGILPHRVLPGLIVAEAGHPGLCLGGDSLRLSCFASRVEKKLSAIALS